MVFVLSNHQDLIFSGKAASSTWCSPHSPQIANEQSSRPSERKSGVSSRGGKGIIESKHNLVLSGSDCNTTRKLLSVETVNVWQSGRDVFAPSGGQRALWQCREYFYPSVMLLHFLSSYCDCCSLMLHENKERSVCSLGMRSIRVNRAATFKEETEALFYF